MSEEKKGKHTPGPYLRAGNMIYALGKAPTTRGRFVESNRMAAQVHFGWADGEVVMPDEQEATFELLQSAPTLLAQRDALAEAGEALVGLLDSDFVHVEAATKKEAAAMEAAVAALRAALAAVGRG